MAGLGLCQCCKEHQLLTEHHAKEIGKKIMICGKCHNVVEEYLKLIVKYRTIHVA